jgi:hypothetical protein
MVTDAGLASDGKPALHAEPAALTAADHLDGPT